MLLIAYREGLAVSRPMQAVNSATRIRRRSEVSTQRAKSRRAGLEPALLAVRTRSALQQHVMRF